MVAKPAASVQLIRAAHFIKKLFLKKSKNFFQKVWRLQNKVVTLHRKTQTNIFKTKK